MSFNIVKLTDPIQFTNVAGGLVPKGAYNAGTDYSVGDSVDYNGSSYVMYVDATAGTLPTDTTKWQVLANKGDTGATGAAGADGADGATGATGPQGIQGVKGDDGDTGPTGATGATGPTGPAGADGADGADGVDGTDGVGVVAGGTAGQVLSKIDATDYNTQWSTPTAYVGDPGSNGILARTALNTTSARTITGTSNQITVTNGDGVSGNPTLSLPQDIHTGATPQFTGLTTTGNISPTTDSARTLGTSSLYWSNTYTDRLYLNATAYLDGGTAGKTAVTGNLDLQTYSIQNAWEVVISDGGDIAAGTTTGMKIGTATTQKIGFYNKTPVAQPSATPADATDLATALTLINDLKAKLISLGLIS